MTKLGAFVFRRQDTVGDPDALRDSFLQDCFVDTGDLAVLVDCSATPRLVVGRTGAGKSALLQRVVETTPNAIVISPENLALDYVTNSNILNYVSQLGVKLDVFFRLLWRHVLFVEIFKRRYSIDSEAKAKSWLGDLWAKFSRDKKRQHYARALDYLQRYGGTFWQDTEHRIKEVTITIEQQLQAAMKTGSGVPIDLSLQRGRSLSEEQRAEVIYRAQSVINAVQARELAGLLDLLNELLDDDQQRYHIVIDRLDEDWVDDHLRYRLIRALLETVRDFHKVRHAKILAALRVDLLDRVFRSTRDAGFQEEKYEPDLVRLRWTASQLTEVLNRRIDALVKRSYTKGSVTFSDVLPARIGKETTISYLLDRTLMRPRDVIQFFNFCIREADGRPNVSVAQFRNAEGEYSRDRLRSLADEWFADYPNLLKCSELLKGRPALFRVGEVPPGEIDDFCLNGIANRGFSATDVISAAALDVVEGKMKGEAFWFEMVEMFYRIGMVGLKLDTAQPTVWAYDGRRSVSTAEVSCMTRVQVHKCFWRVLGIVEVGAPTANHK